MTPIDRDKLRTAMRKMGEEYIYYMLYDAIGLLPETKLRELCEEYYTAAQIAQLERSDDDPIDLLPEVRRFEKASLAKEYYESFEVNSRNFMDTSKGTCAWFACLSATATAEEFAARVVEVVDKHESYRRDAHLAAAQSIATPAQRKALRGIQRR